MSSGKGKAVVDSPGKIRQVPGAVAKRKSNTMPGLDATVDQYHGVSKKPKPVSDEIHAGGKNTYARQAKARAKAEAKAEAEKAKAKAEAEAEAKAAKAKAKRKTKVVAIPIEDLPTDSDKDDEPGSCPPKCVIT